jgi:hypothetical protein
MQEPQVADKARSDGQFGMRSACLSIGFVLTSFLAWRAGHRLRGRCPRLISCQPSGLGGATPRAGIRHLVNLRQGFGAQRDRSSRYLRASITRGARAILWLLQKHGAARGARKCESNVEGRLSRR